MAGALGPLAVALLGLQPQSFPFWTYYAAPWFLGLATGILARASGWTGLRSAGLGLMTVPLWETIWGIADSFGPLLTGGFTLVPYTRHQLSSLYLNKFLSDLGYLLAGFLLYSAPRWSAALRQSPRQLAHALVRAGLPTGRLLRVRSESASALLGLVAFPPLLIVTILLNQLLSSAPALNQSDETSLFANMTSYHAVLISLAAGFGEELLYRGLLQTGLSRRMPMLLAVVLQAVVFGFAHSGYGTWSHVLLPALFGLVAGLTAWGLGLWAAILLHVLSDVVAFGAEASGNEAWVWPALFWLFVANCALTVGWSALQLVRWNERRKARRLPPSPT